MLGFIWRVRGTIRLDTPATNEALLERIENMLERQGKPFAVRNSGGLTFNTPFWAHGLTTNWHAMSGWDHGRVWIEQRPRERFLRYDFGPSRVWPAIAFLLAIVLYFADLGVSPVARLVWIGAILAWLWGAILLIARIRIGDLVERTLRAS